MTTATMEPISKTSRDSESSSDSPSPLLDHYLSLQYRIELVEDEGAWVASNPDLPGCTSFGPDPGAAVKNLAEVRRLWLEGQIESGNKIPEPSDDDRYSGKFVLRIPKSMHRLAEIRARHEGVSLNALVTNILAGALNFGGQVAPTTVATEYGHEHSWHNIFLTSSENVHSWLTKPASCKISDITRSPFLDNVAARLGTHHRSVFRPSQNVSKECYYAEEKRVARK